MSSEKEAEDQEYPRQDLPHQKNNKQNHKNFPIVGLGASAGGLHAFATFFDSLPAKPEMAFVLIQHLAPEHESELAQILQHHTEMPVEQVIDEEKIRVNRVYVIPPGQSLSVKSGTLHLFPPAEPRGQRAPIDLFFSSLAKDQKENAVCVILSGTGSDGTVGLKQIKEQGGIVLVQEPDDAEYDGMPRSALKTGLVDMVAPVSELAQKLLEYRQSTKATQFPGMQATLASEQISALQRIFSQLRSRTGADFSQYKQATVLRRLQRRMQVTQTADLQDYLRLLRREHTEAKLLLKDLLISVTSFFRDPQAWLTLEQEIIPELFEGKGPDDSIRVWVPGCATGEEAYSMAILLLEEARRRKQSPNLQVFATDVNREAIQFARSGLYSKAISADVSSERLERFFDLEGSSYRVRPVLHEIVLFAEHNLIQDAPFARLDLISCRNLFIYLNRDIQMRVFQILRYSLREGGYLFLGNSESATQVNHMFSAVRKRERIYKAIPGKPRLPQLPVKVNWQNQMERDWNFQNNTEAQESTRPISLGEVHRRLMLERYAPPSVLVGPDHGIRYKYGDVGRYLFHHEGEPSLNLLDNVSPQMQTELRSGLFTVFRTHEAIHPRRVRLQNADGATDRITLRIEPVPPDESRDYYLALVIFEPLPGQGSLTLDEADKNDARSGMVEQLEAELRELRHRLQTTAEEYETANEELKTSNEELQSMNEELRSTAEELETSREELRSTNEELTSVNQELKTKIEALRESKNDLENLMEATDIATLFLDRDLYLKRYTPEATQIFNVIPSDVGRPFSHISHKIDHATLPDVADHVLKSLETIEEEVRSKDGRWFLMVMRPYRTAEHQIDGVVVTLVEITALMEAEKVAATRAEQQATVADLGLHALRGFPLPQLIEMAVRKVTDMLKVDFAKVLELQPDGENLLLLSGIGWKEGLVGTAMVDTGLNSQAGYTLHNRKPVVVEDLRTEKRFNGPALLTEHGVISGVSVIIHGSEGPFGVFGAHTQTLRHFSKEDADFLQGMANVLAAAIEHQSVEFKRTELLARVQAEQQRLEAVLQQMPAGVIIAGAPEGQLLLGNDLVEEIWRRPFTKVQKVAEYIQYPGFHLDGTPLASEEWPLARTIATGEVIKAEELIIARGDGTRGVISNSSAPIINDEGEIVAGVVIFQDVTQRKAVEAERDRLLKELQALTATLEDRVTLRTHELQKRSEQLSNMAAALTVAEQRERERISRILHDDLQQLLHAAQMRLMMLSNSLAEAEDESLRREVTELDQLNDRALSVARSLMVELRPPVLEGEGLKEALFWLAGHMESVYGLEVELQAEEDINPANADLRELAFQVVRELLFNVVKHAGVNKAYLTLREADGRCQIIVADRGKGFEASLVQKGIKQRAGYGLQNIQERLELFDGTFALETEPEQGTRVILSLACDDTARSEEDGERI